MTTDDIAAASKRQAQRDSLFLSATLTIEGARQPVTVRVRNLSEGGMMIDGNARFAADQRIEGELRGIGAISGRIAWAEAGRAGVAFDTPVEPRLARAGAATAETVLFKPAPQYDRRPGLRSRS